MATNKNKGWMDTIVSGAGSVLGGAATAVGNGVSTAGRSAGNSVSGATRNWADGLRRFVTVFIRVEEMRCGHFKPHTDRYFQLRQPHQRR